MLQLNFFNLNGKKQGNLVRAIFQDLQYLNFSLIWLLFELLMHEHPNTLLVLQEKVSRSFSEPISKTQLSHKFKHAIEYCPNESLIRYSS